MPTMRAAMRRMMIVGTLLACAACSTDTETHHAMYDGGASAQWWNDHYITMVQDANDLPSATLTPARKPVRIKLF